MIAIHVQHAGVVIRSNPILNIDLLLVPVCPVLNQEKEKKPTLGKKSRGVGSAVYVHLLSLINK